MNTITIRKPDQAAAPAAMFKAPDNQHVAHELFLFFAENLNDGFIVELTSDTRTITQPSGAGAADKKYNDLVAALAQFAAHSDQAGHFDAFMTGYVGEDWRK